jgi:hypothetical protein
VNAKFSGAMPRCAQKLRSLPDGVNTLPPPKVGSSLSAANGVFPTLSFELRLESDNEVNASGGDNSHFSGIDAQIRRIDDVLIFSGTSVRL